LLGFSILYISKKNCRVWCKTRNAAKSIAVHAHRWQRFSQTYWRIRFQLQCGKKSFDIMSGASVDERKKMSRPEVRRNENFLYCLKLMLTRRNYSGRKVQNLMKIGENLECQRTVIHCTAHLKRSERDPHRNTSHHRGQTMIVCSVYSSSSSFIVPPGSINNPRQMYQNVK